MAMTARTVLWDDKLSPITKKVLREPMELELRERLLNERLVDQYYARRAAAVKELADNLQRRHRAQ